MASTMYASTPPNDLEAILPGLGTIVGLGYRSVGEAGHALAFPLSKGKVGKAEEYDLGAFGPDVENVIRITRDKVYWLFPSPSRDLPTNVDTQLLLVQLRGGKVAALLPFTTSEYMGTFRGSWHNSICVRFERDDADAWIDGAVQAKVAIALNTTAEGAVKDVVHVLRIIRDGEETAVAGGGEGDHIFEGGLTYCTWNSLQPPLFPSTTSVLAALDSFMLRDIHPRTFLIDDGWQDVHENRLQSFEANKVFLDGMADLGELVERAKDMYGVKQVGAWHTVQGFWCGVEPSKFIRTYRLIKVTKDGYPGPAEPEGFSYYIPHPWDVAEFFDDYYASLASFGVSFTKCDNMASLDNIVKAREVLSFTDGNETLGSSVPIPEIRSAYKDAIIAAATKHFGGAAGGRVIFCMEMSPRVLLGDQIGLPKGKALSMVLRNSDDYYPNEPDSHRYHIYTNASNAMFTSQLNVIPDFDMFQTHPFVPPNQHADDVGQLHTGPEYPQAAFHAALRALGAGPVTFTDVPEKTDENIIKRLIGSTSEASQSVAVHAAASPFVSNDIFDPTLLQGGVGRALRVFSRANIGDAGGMIGYWNVRSNDGQVEDSVTLADVRQLSSSDAQDSFVVYSQAWNEVRIVTPDHVENNLMELHLGPFEFDLFTVAPIVRYSDSVEIAALGLTDKYNTLAGLVSFDPKTLEAEVKCSGVLAFWVRAPEAIQWEMEVDGNEVTAGLLPIEDGSLLCFDLSSLLSNRKVDDPFHVQLRLV